MRHVRRQWLAFSLLGMVACATGTSIQRPEGEARYYPSAAWFERTESGTRLRLPEIRDARGALLRWTDLYAAYDGFSPVQPILVPTRNGCPTLLAPGAEAASVAATAPIGLYDLATRRWLPWFGEPAADPNLCLVYPLAPFSSGGTAVVVVRSSFSGTLAGEPPAAWGTDELAAVGIDPAGVRVAWSFPVGTHANRIATLYRLRDAALAWAAAATSLVVTIERTPPEAPTEATRLAWKGRYRVPWFLDASGRIRFDAAGRPVLQGEYHDQFFLILPERAVTQPVLRLVQYGHGLFGDPREVWYGSQGPLRSEVAALFGAVAWGMAVRYFGAAAEALLAPENLGVLRDHVFQGFVHQLLFTRVLRDELGPRVAAELGLPVSGVVDYIGISQGGILGAVLAALSPDLRRVVLHVGGGGWTAMMTHSSNWRNPGGLAYGDIVDATIPDPTQRSYFLAAWQPVWDQWDPVLYAPYWLTAPPGLVGPPSERRVYYPYAIDDPQVANFASETVLRSADVPLLVPSVTAPWGIATVTYADGPFRVVASQWDVGGGEPAHGEVRKLPAFTRQVAGFLVDGTLSDTCGGPCRFTLD